MIYDVIDYDFDDWNGRWTTGLGRQAARGS